MFGAICHLGKGLCALSCLPDRLHGRGRRRPSHPRSLMAHRRLAGAAVASLIALGFAPSGASAQSYDPSTVIVKFQPGTPGATERAALNVPGVGQTVGSIEGVGANVVRVRQDPAVVAERLRRNPN